MNHVCRLQTQAEKNFHKRRVSSGSSAELSISLKVLTASCAMSGPSWAKMEGAVSPILPTASAKEVSTEMATVLNEAKAE